MNILKIIFRLNKNPNKFNNLIKLLNLMKNNLTIINNIIIKMIIKYK
jgi:hypothetical protein